MKNLRFLLWPILGLISAAASVGAAPSKPNVIFILCDDLGYGDVGVFYQNSRPANLPSFQTPNIDLLATGGLMMTNHYSAAPVCGPARASLILGQNQGHANLRDNQFDKPISPGPTLGSVMQTAGYYTGAIGKWGLGGSAAPFTAHPLDRGFNEFYGFMLHGDAHQHYPGNSGIIYDGKTPVTSGLVGAYSTDLFTARAKKFIEDHETAAPNQPFFLYLAYTAPHVMLQVANQAYPAGGGLTGGLQWPLNTLTGGTNDTYIYPTYAAQTTWTPAAQRHASMIRRLDQGIGDIRQLLTDLGIDQNTIIIFTSDNGPSNEADGGAYSSDPRLFDSWGPFDGIKRDLWEGGYREPTIVWAPGRVPAGTVSTYASAFWDWMPTLAEIGGVPSPVGSDGVSLVPVLTQSGSPHLHGPLYFEYYYDGSFGVDGGPTGLFARKDVTGREQMQSVRIGDFKGVRYQITGPDNPLRLYNVTLDPHEDHDISTDPQYASLLQQMHDTLIQCHLTNTSAPRPYDGALVPAFKTGTSPGILYSTYAGAWPWLPDFTNFTPASTGTSTRPDLSVRPADTNYGILFSGYVYAPEDGTYTFYLHGDDGVYLRVHDISLIDDASVVTGQEQSAQIALKAGLHPISLSYQHGSSGTAALDFEWSGPTFARRAFNAGELRVDGPPVLTAFPVSSQTTADTAVAIPVLANDIPGSGDLRIVSVGQARGGSVQVTGDQITYTPKAGFLGTDHFTCVVGDDSATAPEDVTVNVYSDDGTLWLPFDETSGQAVSDASGEPRGSLQGFSASPWIAGVQGGAIQFNSSTQSVLITSFTPVVGKAPRSFTAWLKPDATQAANAAWLSYGTNTTGNRITLRVDPSNAFVLRLEVQNGYVVGTTPLNDGKWHHVAVVISDANNDGTTNVTESKLYVDGKAEAITKSLSAAINTSATSTITIGAANFATTYSYSGAIDDLRAFPYALTAAQVTALATEDATPQATVWNRRYFGSLLASWNTVDGTNGLDHLTEYAQGLAPGVAATSTSQVGPAAGGGIQFTYRQRRNSDAAYQLQTSTDLQQWTNGGATVVSQTPSADDPDDFDDLVVAPPAGVKSLFFRLQYQLP